MKILAIETSCDETAISILEAGGNLENPEFNVLAHIVHSQIDIHKNYGGVFPTLAKREHEKNLVPVLIESLKKARLLKKGGFGSQATELIQELFSKNTELQKSFESEITEIEKPNIDYITVTEGPGLEPALWTGITFAKALSTLWNIPVIPVNHMEGHLASALFSKDKIGFPTLALLVSGGHTEYVLAKQWSKYKIIGETHDDAVGEAFDKVARLLGLSYPGGPEISRLAEENRKKNTESGYFKLPRPMLNSGDLNLSFSGLKTAVRYALEKEPELTPEIKQTMAREFEDSICDIFISKTKSALDEYYPKTFILAGGVSANKHLREVLGNLLKEYPETKYIIPEIHLSTDNATMIGAAGYIKILQNRKDTGKITAKGNLRLDSMRTF